MYILAQNLTLPGGTTINGPPELTKTFGANFQILDLVQRSFPFIWGFAGLALLIMLIAGGFGVLTSAGDAKKLASASQRLTYAIVGFLIIFVAYFLVQILGRVFGLPEIQSTFK